VSSLPYLSQIEIRYDNGMYIIHNPSDLISNFPFLDGKIIRGEIVSTYRDGKTIRVNREFRFRLTRGGAAPIGEILEPNPIKDLGFPLPCYCLSIVYLYEEEKDGESKCFPIVEGMLMKGSVSYYFEDEVKRILKEEEAGIILEGTIFHEQLQRLSSNLKESLLSFEQENFAYTKTSCRKILEEIRRIITEWKTIDGSISLCEKLKSVINSLYSFASIGGPHEGVTTKEETEFILKSTTSLFFYINSLLKNQRIGLRS